MPLNDQGKQNQNSQNNKTRNIVRVAIQRPIFKLLDYSCDFVKTPSSGCRVRIPLGNSSVIGLVVETGVNSELDHLKSLIEILDVHPLLDEAMLELLKWASDYYHYPFGEVLFHALPNALRKGKALPKIRFWRANSAGFALPEKELKRAPKQLAMLKQLKNAEQDAIQLQQAFGDGWRRILKQLEKKALLKTREVEPVYSENGSGQRSAAGMPAKGKLTLTGEQQHSVEQITECFQESRPKPVLLHGVTGSGKTEVYLQSIESLLEAGKQVLVLVPEIGLTPQILFRFQEHFPQYSIASLHSGLADNARMAVWLGAKAGAIDIVIGTRSAVFTPMKNLGAILIDEEHDASFKQQEGFLYQGRDMAIKRAYDASIPVLLGSATPSLESLHNALRQRYRYLRLASRPGVREAPEMILQDTRALPLEAGVSSLLMDEIRQHIHAGNQVMLFLNRRGFAPILMCPACGWNAHCQRCDLGMTYHAAAQKVICHHCGVEHAVKPTCPDCGNDRLTTQGQGTERIEQVLKSHFPTTPVIRIDRDSTSRKGSLEKKLHQVHGGEPVILIGTQMLTKGHDFSGLTLVGILDVDQALFSMDYRAQERLAQQVLQVAGRAGRGEKKGRVVLQTSQPEHPLLLSLLSQGYYQTALQMLNERRQWRYPPYGSQALIRVSANKAEAGLVFLNKFRSVLQSCLEEDASIELLGPMPSPLSKKANRYRFQLLIGSPHRPLLHQLLDKAMPDLLRIRKTGGVRWAIDVDPTDFL